MPIYTGLIDLHSHVLPRIDDGARNMRQTMQLLSACIDDGITTIVATPHFFQSASNGLLSKRMTALQNTRKAIAKAHLDIEILPGFEVGGDITLLNRPSLGSLTLDGTKWLLLERPYIYEDEFDSAIQYVFDSGLRPLIAHPERYDYFTSDFSHLEEYIAHGAWAQVTAGAVAGRQGLGRQEWCLRAIQLNLVHIIATDTHDINRRRPLMQEAIAVIEKYFDEAMVNKIFYQNPENLLERRSN